jgi:hypothetical protein
MAQQSDLIFDDHVASAREYLAQMSDLLRDTMQITAATRKAIAQSQALIIQADRVLARRWF